MTRRPEHFGPRRDFSPKVKAQARERADGHCEQWRDIPEFDGAYEVSSLGRVRSKERRVKNSRNDTEKVWREKLLTGTVHTNGYLTVMMRRNGKNYRRFIHRLVLQAFVGPAPKGHECRHLNGVRSDNRLSNLVWGTKKQNIADKRLHGTQLSGEDCPASKLRHTQVVAIKWAIAAGVPQAKIARHFGVSSATINDIHRRRTWRCSK